MPVRPRGEARTVPPAAADSALRNVSFGAPSGLGPATTKSSDIGAWLAIVAYDNGARSGAPSIEIDAMNRGTTPKQCAAAAQASGGAAGLVEVLEQATAQRRAATTVKKRRWVKASSGKGFAASDAPPPPSIQKAEPALTAPTGSRHDLARVTAPLSEVRRRAAPRSPSFSSGRALQRRMARALYRGSS